MSYHSDQDGDLRSTPLESGPGGIAITKRSADATVHNGTRQFGGSFTLRGVHSGTAQLPRPYGDPIFAAAPSHCAIVQSARLSVQSWLTPRTAP